MDYYRFAEALLEFITPVDGDIEHMRPLCAICIVIRRAIWAMSGCAVKYAMLHRRRSGHRTGTVRTSNTGRFKTLYREGLKNRYAR